MPPCKWTLLYVAPILNPLKNIPIHLVTIQFLNSFGGEGFICSAYFFQEENLCLYIRLYWTLRSNYWAEGNEIEGWSCEGKIIRQENYLISSVIYSLLEKENHSLEIVKEVLLLARRDQGNWRGWNSQAYTHKFPYSKCSGWIMSPRPSECALIWKLGLYICNLLRILTCGASGWLSPKSMRSLISGL